jgi:hypothetical protein
MTRTLKYEEFVSNSGLMLFIEQYADKPHFAPLWRYGSKFEYNGKTYSQIYGRDLMSKPNKKRLIERY